MLRLALPVLDATVAAVENEESDHWFGAWWRLLNWLGWRRLTMGVGMVFALVTFEKSVDDRRVLLRLLVASRTDSLLDFAKSFDRETPFMHPLLRRIVSWA
jgi:hypothetical protein